MSNTVKQNLFRFVTLRNPQLIDDKDKDFGFVFHPEEKNSTFAKIASEAKEEDRVKALHDEAARFNPFKTRTETKTVNSKLYAFSSWLMRNKNSLSYKNIKANSVDAVALSPDEELLIWENLIYQTIERQSVYVREALIQLLIANKFLAAFLKFSEGLGDDIVFTDDQEKEFTRRAHANVVLSKYLTIGEPSNEKRRPVISTSQAKRIHNMLDVALAEERISKYETLLKELEPVALAYTKSNQKAYGDALNQHNTDVEKLIDETTPVMVEVTDPKTGRISSEKTYPGLTLPEFSFSKEDAITEAYLDSKLSDASLSVFVTSGLEVYDDFSEVKDAINDLIKTDQKTISRKTPKKQKRVKIGGATLKAQRQSSTYDYNIPNLMEINPAGLARPLMILVNDMEAIQVASMTCTISFSDGSTTTESGFDTIATNSRYLKLFPSGVSFPANTETYTLSGTLTLTSGESYTFEQVVDTKSRLNLGMFDDAQDTPNTTTEVYGVTKLGIADFRRVEQEVCCYVAGEVSHIENVMAREYKERATRSLLSSETTVERTDETERENLTDTTTTERNEMQSEVASVLNEDNSQAQGVNASVRGGGKNWGFDVGGFSDSSSSSSTSNSNSQAQTYAQEITERAMERIVSKTSTKRTSRILKEFEENNKHGFDNTKGEKHVTGVYRWVDKIYKNTLINYGKRLMYEFAIPEPSKFFKEAIWKQVENNQLESGVIMPEAPTHPKDLVGGVDDASQLTASNYQTIAAEYNANVEARPLQTIKMSNAYSHKFYGEEAQGHDGHSKNAKDFDFDIPENYYTNTIDLKGNIIREGDKGIAHAKIFIGDKTHTFTSTSGWREITYNNSALYQNYKNTLPISIATEDVEPINFNVVAHCTLTSEAEQQWQNETYAAIMDAYYERLREYNDAQNQDIVIPVEQEKLKFNPLFNRSLEKKELKRIAIELLAEQKGHAVSKDNYGPLNESTSVSKVNKTEALKRHASTVKFFEQAFDWDIMAYMFYPYFYAQEDKWEALFQEQDAADPLFQAFLQSGMARTVVPVRPGFEDAVNWYMETGEIWNGEGLVIDQDDDLYISIAEEMQTTEGVVEGSWETRLPTALTVLQAGSIGLKVEGLPCNTECNDFKLFDSDGEEILDENGESFTNPIEQTNTLIGGDAGVGDSGNTTT